VGGDYRGGIRHQIGAPWNGAPQEIRSDYLQKPLPTGKISGQARSAKKEPHRGAPTETSKPVTGCCGPYPCPLAGLSNYSALFARAAFLAARSA
jgi:hypothetical protein